MADDPSPPLPPEREPSAPQWRAYLLRGLLPLVLVGLAMITCATLFLTWPSDVPGEVYARLVPHWIRMLGQPAEGIVLVERPLTFDWAWRRIWDGTHYLLLLSGFGLAAWAAHTPRPWPWIGLAAVGVLGLIYTAGLTLYVGPMCAAPGYLLVLLPALLTLLTLPGRVAITPE